MCDACDRLLGRRSVLRGALMGGTAIAGATLWRPRGVTAADDGSSTFEQAAMGEDTLVTGSARPSTTSSGATVTVKSGSNTSTATQTSGSVRALRVAPALNPQPLKAPMIATRAQWGADESIRGDNRSYAPVRKLIVHHSASDNNPRNPASVVRFIDKYHTTGRGFTDTGYNYLIDHKGAIYEGRAARKYAPGEVITDEDNKGWGVVGAHAKGNNAGSCGICLIGNFDTGSPTDAAVASLVALLAYKASLHRIDAGASDEYIDIYGSHRVYPNIAGHRQVGSTACPGKNLYSLLPSIRQEVVRRAGHWDAATVDIPFLLRWEGGPLRAPRASSGGGSGSSGGTGDPGGGTKLVGFRVVSSAGTVYTAGKGRKQGNPAADGGKNIVALANAASGDGYWALGKDGTVYGYGGVEVPGHATRKGTAADIAVTADGGGYWILTRDGGIYPFGSAGYASSPKKAGLGGTALKIAARPQGDGYWVLMAGNIVRGFGSARAFGAPTDSGKVVDIAPTPTGAGYWALTDTGVVAAYGDAVDKGDAKRSKVKWSKLATHLVATPSGKGYVIVNSEGAMRSFGDAPTFASFAGSGIQATGVAPAFA